MRTAKMSALDSRGAISNSWLDSDYNQHSNQLKPFDRLAQFALSPCNTHTNACLFPAIQKGQCDCTNNDDIAIFHQIQNNEMFAIRKMKIFVKPSLLLWKMYLHIFIIFNGNATHVTCWNIAPNDEICKTKQIGKAKTNRWMAAAARKLLLANYSIRKS